MAYTTIDKPTDYFRTKTYTGNGGTQSITFDESDNMQPDCIWIKDRDNAYSHLLVDSIRGNTKTLNSNETSAEGTASDRVTSFDSNGFSLGSYIGSNKSSSNVVSWNWLAGGSASSNTDGSITSTVSANTTAGFSIVTWTAPSSGANTDTIGHGLSAVPKMIIARTRSNVDGWRVYHHVPGIDKHGSLNSTNAFNSNTNIFPTLPTTSIFYPGSDASINSSSRTYVAYCFAPKSGFSSMGQYTGNGSTDGTFVYTGFKPAFVIFKSSSRTTTNWQLLDNKRNTFNPENNHLRPNSSGAEFTNYPVDFISNGFKFRNTDSDNNFSGETYIYMAFAENPFVTSTGIPTTAR